MRGAIDQILWWVLCTAPWINPSCILMTLHIYWSFILAFFFMTALKLSYWGFLVGSIYANIAINHIAARRDFINRRGFTKACETLEYAGTIDSNVFTIASYSERFCRLWAWWGPFFKFLSMILHCEGLGIKGKDMFRYCLHLLD